jgi:hypothetical protein
MKKTPGRIMTAFLAVARAEGEGRSSERKNSVVAGVQEPQRNTEYRIQNTEIRSLISLARHK